MAESDKIKHSDLVEDGLMNPTIKNFEQLIEVVDKADASLVKFGKDLNASLQNIQPNSVQNLQAIFNLSNQINEADKSKIATAQILKELRLQEIEQKQRLKNQMAAEAREEKEKAKRLKEQESAYGRLAAKYRETANAAKNLAAQYGVESKQAKEAIKRAKEYNDQLKRIDASMGNHQRNVGNYSSAMGGLNKALGFFGASIGGAFILGKMKESVQAFVEAEKNANALRFALTNVAGEGEIAFNKLIEQSNKLQESGGIFSDDEIQKAQTQLVNFGLLSTEVEALMPKILDLATVQGVDLATATDTVIKGINGQTKGLKSVGLGFEDTGSKAGNYAKVLDGLTKFEGAAADAATTTEGKYKVLMNRFDDLQEDIGEFLVNAGSDFLGFWDLLTGKIDMTTARIQAYQNVFAGAFGTETDKLLSQISGLTGEQQIKFLDEAIAASHRNISTLNQQYKDGIINAEQFVAAVQAQQDQIKRLQGARSTAGQPVQTLDQRINQSEDKQKAASDKRKKGYSDEAMAIYKAQRAANAQAYKDQEDAVRKQKELVDKHNQHRLDLYLEDLKAKQEADQKRYESEKRTNDKITEDRKKANEEAIADLERIAQAVSASIDARLDAQQSGLERESQLISNEQQIQGDLFARGLENNLATQNRLQAENAAKQAEIEEKRRKKEEASQLASLFLEILKKDGNIPKALAETFVAKGISAAIAGSFAEGVENFKGEGTGTSDSNIIRFSNGESVVTASGTASNPGLVTAMNEGRVDEYFRDIYLPQFAQSMKVNGESQQMGASWESAVLVKKLDELKTVIASKKETNVELGRMGEVITNTVESGIRRIVVKKPRKF